MPSRLRPRWSVGAVRSHLAVLTPPLPAPLGALPAILVRQERFGPLVVVLTDDPVGPLDRFVQQAGQPDRGPFAGLEGPAVLAEDRAEGDVLEFHVAVAPEPRGGKELVEVERLSVVDDVENRVGLPLAHA